MQRHAALLEARTGRQVTISAVSARRRDKERGVRLGAYAWEDDPVALATREALTRTYGPDDPVGEAEALLQPAQDLLD